MANYQEMPTTSISATRNEQWYEEVERKVRTVWRKKKNYRENKYVEKADKIARNVSNLIKRNLFSKYYWAVKLYIYSHCSQSADSTEKK